MSDVAVAEKIVDAPAVPAEPAAIAPVKGSEADAAAEAAALAIQTEQDEKVFGKAPEGAEAEIKAEADAEVAKAAADKAEADAKGDWPEDWREKLAGNDEKMLARLRRFGSVNGVLRAYAELEKKVSGGGLKKALSDKPTAEELSAYRKENGIPEDAAGYEIQVPDGLDKSVKQGMDAFAKEMHAINAPPAVVKAAADLYLRAENAAEQERYDFAQKQTIDNKATLKAEFGREFDAEVRRANSLLVTTMGEDAKEFMLTTLADGTKLGDNPAFVRFTAQIARTLADDTTLISQDGGSGGQSLKAEYDGLLGLMTTDYKKYNLPQTQSRITELANKLETRGWK